jgi:hypothetical protein
MTRSGELSLLVAVALAAGSLGPLDPAAWTILFLLSTGAWAVSAARQARDEATGGPAAPLAAWGPAVALAAVIPRLTDPMGRLALLALAVSLCRTPARRQASRFTTAALGLSLVLEMLPLAWSTEVELSRLVSSALGRVAGAPLDGGPSATGLDLLLLALLLILARRHEPGDLRARRAAACAGVWLSFVALAPRVAGWRPAWLFAPGGVLNQGREHLEAAPAALAPTVFALSWVLLAALGAACVARRTAQPPGGLPPRRLAAGRTAWVAAASAAALAVALCAAWWPGAPRPRGRVVLVNSRWIDFQAPRPGAHGIASSGMFGLLGRYLARQGHRMEVVQRPVTAAALSGASIVMVPLPDAAFDPDEKAALDRFVRRGASMLVLADHTDLLGTMEAINALTGPYGARVRFDSAYPARRGWRGCLRIRRPLRTEGDTGIGTGASVQVSGRARELVVGRHALGDAGDRSNGGAGGYLGDYAWQPGERLGDLVLASETRAGRGRVVVMGDTSSFQNVALPWCHAFVAALFDHLARRPRPWSTAASLMCGLAGAALIGVASRTRHPVAWGVAAASAVLAAGVVLAWSDGKAGPDPGTGPGPDALVVDGHLGGWTRELWRDASLGGLMANLQRAGFLPVAAPGLPAKPIDTDALVVLVAPRVVLSGAEALRLADHVERGGRVLVAAGGESASAVAPLLGMYGLTVRVLPLGPVPVRGSLSRDAQEAALHEPQFRNAHPVESAGLAPVRAWHRAFDHDVVVRARGRSGRGALIVVGDGEFLTDRVLESERTAWPGNVALLASLLSEAP